MRRFCYLSRDSFTIFFLLFVTLIIPKTIFASQEQKIADDNLTPNWDGNGATGNGSEPNNFGWDCSPAVTWTQANVFGIRYQDDQTYSYNGNNLGGRILFIRWDGINGSSSSSIYSYPTSTLESCKTYIIKAKIAWHNNAGSPIFTFGINDTKDGLSSNLAETSVTVPSKGVMHDVELIFTTQESKNYFITITSTSQCLGAIRDLTLTEYNGKSFINTSENELIFDSLNLSQTFNIDAFGLTENISFDTPEGMTITPASITPKEIKCGSIAVTVEFNDASYLTSGDLIISSDTISTAINIRKILPPWIAEGTDSITSDGTWCWFQDPRAVYYEGEKKQTYTGWITSKGKVQVASYNHETGEVIQKTISPPDFMQVDDHNNPTFLIRDDGRILVAYSGHFYGPMRVIVSTNPEDITSFGPEANFGSNVTYANPYQIGDTTAMFYRDGSTWHPTINISTDGGITWGTPQELITRNGSRQRPYVKYTQDSNGGMHLTFTTGHPRQEQQNHIYYIYFKDNKFYKADGTFVKNYNGASDALNIDHGEAEVVYDGSTGKGWTWDIALDEEENPVILYATFPNDLNHNYFYASWDGSKWIKNHIVNSGRWFPQTPAGGNEPEPNYSGGMVLDPENPSIVFLSKQVNGVFEIFKYETTDKGTTWQTQAITENTPDGTLNVRPVIPRGHKQGSFDVIWMRGKYITYSNYHTSVMYYSPNKVKTKLDSIKINGQLLNDFIANSTEYNVELEDEVSAIPEVEAFCHIPFSNIEITQATTIPGQAIIKLTSEGKAKTTTYTINFMKQQNTSVDNSTQNSRQFIYPNPTSGLVSIDLTQLKSADSINVYDVKGSVIREINEINNSELVLDLRDLKTGLYYVNINNSNRQIIASNKLIKK